MTRPARSPDDGATGVTPCLWFDGRAEEAARFYVSLLPGSRIDAVVPGPEGRALWVDFTLAGRPYAALNGGAGFPFTPAISLVAAAADQTELDRLWAALLEGGTPERCGWLRDRYGVSWQVVPAALGAMMRGADPARAGRLREAILRMVKLDVAALEAAYEGRPAP